MTLRLLIGLLLTQVVTAWCIGSPHPRIAVASNFHRTIKQLAERYEDSSGQSVSISTGSSGKLYAQIKHGAPYDAFFSADSKRPRLLAEETIGVASSRFTYAIGILAFWTPKIASPNSETISQLRHQRIAIANPKLAPYGQGAQEVLLKFGQWPPSDNTIIKGENVSQCFHFVSTGNAAAGFVAYSQVLGIFETAAPNAPLRKVWLPSQADYTPIRQDAILLTDNPIAIDFLAFCRSKEAIEIIRNAGYEIPQ